MITLAGDAQVLRVSPACRTVPGYGQDRAHEHR
jgi:hypothetical protein